MLKSLSYLLFILLLNLPQLHSKLYLTKLITLSEALEINIQTKFKFTDVMITEKTSAAIQNCSLQDRSQLPEVQIKNNGVIGKRYHQINQNEGVYIFLDVMDRAQLRQYAQSLSQVEDSSRHKMDFIVFEEDSKQLLKEVNVDLNKVCFTSKNLTSISKSTTEVKQMMKSCFDLFNKESQSPLESQQTIHQNTGTFSQILVSCSLLLLFSISKHLYISFRTKKDSVV